MSHLYMTAWQLERSSQVWYVFVHQFWLTMEHRWLASIQTLSYREGCLSSQDWHEELTPTIWTRYDCDLDQGSRGCEASFLPLSYPASFLPLSYPASFLPLSYPANFLPLSYPASFLPLSYPASFPPLSYPVSFLPLSYPASFPSFSYPVSFLPLSYPASFLPLSYPASFLPLSYPAISFKLETIDHLFKSEGLGSLNRATDRQKCFFSIKWGILNEVIFIFVTFYVY